MRAEQQELFPQEISTNELDRALQKVLDARADYEAKKEISTAAYHEKDRLESEFLGMLEKAGKTSWKCDGLGTASIVETLTVPTPKTIEQKRALWQYVVGKYGEDLAMEKFGMHSKTLNSFYKQEFEAAEDASLFDLPGCEAPIANKEFRFRKA